MLARTVSIAFFLAILGCGLLFYWRYSSSPAKQSEPVTGTEVPGSNPSTTPRLAAAIAAPAHGEDRGRETRDGAMDDVVPVSDEQVLLEQIRATLITNPPLAETLARESRERFPSGPHADERDAALVRALMNQGRVDHARSEAYYYYAHHRDGRYTSEISAMVGVPPPMP